MDTQVARERLLEMQQQLMADIDGIRSRLESGVLPDTPEGGADFGDRGAHEQFAAQDEGLLDGAKRRLASVEDALKRIEAGTYGISVVSGKPIPEERLEARPDAATLTDEDIADAPLH
ncbi:TraR/DksA family transcriptional regulator [Kineococcus sp. SYSU DK004]|uniref:TraR/DksA family transcriptional regulator n=1 Tax=Kineococcus sp. SYSU DK004 TaxID=3383125 RepID=UPI003D7C40D4